MVLPRPARLGRLSALRSRAAPSLLAPSRPTPTPQTLAPPTLPAAASAFSTSPSPAAGSRRDGPTFTEFLKILFKGTPKKPTSSERLSAFTAAATSSSPDRRLISQTYLELKTLPSPPAPLPDVLRNAMRVLCVSPHKRDLRVLQDMFDDLHSLWAIPYTLDDAHALLRGLARHARARETLRVLRALEDGVYGEHVRPGLMDYNVALAAFARAADADGALEVWALLRAHGGSPDRFSFNSLLSALFRAGRGVDVPAVLEEMERAGVRRDLVTATTILDGFVKAEEWEKAGEAEALVRELGRDGLDARAWAGLIGLAARRDGFDAGLATLRECVNAGGDVNEVTLATLLRVAPPLTTYAEARALLDDLASETGVEPDLRAHSILLNNLLSTSSLSAALELYDSSPYPRDLPLIQPLMHALTSNPATRDLPRALKIYGDLDASSNPPDAPLFRTLLHACAAEGNVGAAVRLLGDMKAAGVSVEPGQVVSTAIALMRASRDHAQAFQAYAYILNLNRVGVDADGFAALISAFSNLSFTRLSPSPTAPSKPVRGTAPPILFAEILKDMRAAGHPPTARTYTVLLDYYARVRDREAVRKVHALLTMDLSLRPDTHLHNALMNAYNRSGEPARALALWDTLLLSNAFDHASVSIALDACGRGGATAGLGKGRGIVETLGARRWRMNRRNWESWVEALVRLGRPADAEEVLRVRMPREGWEVDENGLRTLLRMVRAFGGRGLDELKDRLREAYPELWESVKDIGERERAVEPEEARRRGDAR